MVQKEEMATEKRGVQTKERADQRAIVKMKKAQFVGDAATRAAAQLARSRPKPTSNLGSLLLSPRPSSS
jgi:hypothetical protein